MTLEQIAALVVSVDPDAQRYESTEKGDAYTVWYEYRRIEQTADNVHGEGWAFQVDRFTRIEDDPVASALFDALDTDVRVAVNHLIDYEPDTGYIHHIFDCEGM